MASGIEPLATRGIEQAATEAAPQKQEAAPPPPKDDGDAAVVRISPEAQRSGAESQAAVEEVTTKE